MFLYFCIIDQKPGNGTASNGLEKKIEDPAAEPTTDVVEAKTVSEAEGQVKVSEYHFKSTFN